MLTINPQQVPLYGNELAERERKEVVVERLESESSNSIIVLRAEVRRLRAALERANQNVEPDRDVDSVTNTLAMQQALETLRKSLNEKDRVIESTAEQCRHLEDDLEDQRLAYEGLLQDLERNKQSLAAAREQTARLSKERLELEERYQAAADSGNPASGLESSIGNPADGPPAPAAAKHSLKPIATSLIVLTLVAAGLGAFLWFTGLPSFGGATEQQDIPAQPADQSLQTPATLPETGGIPDGTAPETLVQAAPQVPHTLRDQLRGGSAGPLMAVIPSTEFTMGKTTSIPSDDRGPAHPVSLHSYLIGITEVTFGEYDRFVRATGARTPDDFGWGRKARPVVGVSWDEARAYARWLSQQTGKGYRLPSEAEWEYAHSAGQRSTYWWGYELEQGRAACFDCGSRWDRLSTAPVASFAPNPFGLKDTAGNVMEWVEDCYHPNYKEAPPNGRAWVTGDCGVRVARGGAFNKPARSMTTTARSRFSSDSRINMLGFRIARDL